MDEIKINESIFINPVVPTHQDIIDSMNAQLMESFLYVGIICLMCAAWNMSKYSHNDDLITSFINGFINMLAFGAGVASIGYYAISKGWY